MVRRIVALASLAVCAASAPAVLIVVHLDQTDFVVQRGDFVEVTGWVENITGGPVTLPSGFSSAWNFEMTTEPAGVDSWWYGPDKPAGVYYTGVLATFSVLPTSPYQTHDYKIGPSLSDEGLRVPFTVTTVPVPEPASLAVLGPGALALARRRKLHATRR